MGKVFTWDEVRQGMIPQLDSFTKISSEVRRVLEDSSAISAVICGSVNHGHQNVRSDIDLFVFYEERDKTEMVALMLYLGEFAQDWFVPIDFIQLTPELAGSNMCSISPSMARHIECSARRGGLIGLNPFYVTDVYALNHRAEAINWTRQKIRMLDEGAVCRYSETHEAQFLQKLLEAPINGTRKLLLVNGSFEDDSKQAVLDLAGERFPELIESLTGLLVIDAAYTEVIRRNIDYPEKQDEKDYSEALLMIRDQIERTSRYMKAIGRLLES